MERGRTMHAKLKKLQKGFVRTVKGNMEILEIDRPGPIVLAAMAVAAHPLTLQELADLSELPKGEVRVVLDRMLDRGLAVQAEVKGRKGTLFELNPDFDEVLEERVKEKADRVSRNSMEFFGGARKTIADSLKHFSSEDRLYARMLLHHFKRMERIHHLIQKKLFLLSFVEGQESSDRDLEKVSIK